MLVTRFILRMCSAALIISGAAAQDYPTRTVRIVTGSAGGITDFSSRQIAQGISGPLGQPVIVDNRSGLPGEVVSRSQPDGYTLLVDGSSHWLLPLLRDKAPYDAVRDYLPITLAVTSPNVVVVHPSVAANSVKELIALAKAKPGALNYASGSIGSSNHLPVELFKSMAGVNIVWVGYKGGGPAVNALVAGEVQMMIASASSSLGQVRAGKLRALAVASSQPSALVPGVPTVAASGLPGFESSVILGVFAPARTPAAIVNRLNREMARVLNSAEVKERLFNVGVEAVGSSPEQLATAVKSEMTVFGKVIKDLGIRIE